MTSLLGSKRWITAVAATGVLIAMSGCAASGQDDGGAAAPAASATSAASEAATPTPTPTPSASEAPAPSASATPSSAPAPAPAPAPSSSPSSSPAASPSTPAAGGPCTAGQLTGAVADQLGGGAAGSVYRSLVLTNASDRECTVQGFPGVSFVDASGTQIGAAADRDGSAAALVTLAPGASATATLRQVNAQNYGADCELTPSAGLRVYPPGSTDSLVLPQEIPACSAASIVLMTVGTLQPAS
ncbi:DUF4232 domain-containing protein [Arthrobacter sp. NPDC092385]|uniref:DUF4232 domain-containing protein n=1 Tax=Arthrobacter sp. NPDC092385 TaxID=3363943 RepID=UPI00382E8AC8